jgi:hypothetical protein
MISFNHIAVFRAEQNVFHVRDRLQKRRPLPGCAEKYTATFRKYIFRV